MKLDGERHAPDDNGPYTVVVSGSPLDGSYLRAKMNSLEEALGKVVFEFAVGAQDGTIRTLFRPKDGLNYWNKQVGP